mmetsp:Transcript_10495/g.36612  ORF Transcript_10495/g.36612 Transcript_10495/m.36612 type:complete len:310 (-) Transcript_10495:301-1230(-)
MGPLGGMRTPQRSKRRSTMAVGGTSGTSKILFSRYSFCRASRTRSRSASARRRARETLTRAASSTSGVLLGSLSQVGHDHEPTTGPGSGVTHARCHERLHVSHSRSEPSRSQPAHATLWKYGNAHEKGTTSSNSALLTLRWLRRTTACGRGASLVESPGPRADKACTPLASVEVVLAPSAPPEAVPPDRDERPLELREPSPSSSEGSSRIALRFATIASRRAHSSPTYTRARSSSGTLSSRQRGHAQSSSGKSKSGGRRQETWKARLHESQHSRSPPEPHTAQTSSWNSRLRPSPRFHCEWRGSFFHTP